MDVAGCYAGAMVRRAWLSVVWLSLACNPAPAPKQDVPVPDARVPDELAKLMPEVAAGPVDPWVTDAYKPAHAQACGLDAAGFMALHPEPKYLEKVSYKPEKAASLAKIASYVGLTETQRAGLANNGFVAVGHSKPHTFATAYLDLYTEHLPVLVTADSLLYALHRSFDSLLIEFEGRVIVPATGEMLTGMHEQLAKELAGLPAELRPAGLDVDVYLAVARSLLDGVPVAPVSGDAAAQASVTEILKAAEALQPAGLTLFGLTTQHDMSQLRPRGHYVGHPPFEQYFRAMMWLGRAELAMVTFDAQRKPRFNRRALEGAYLVNHLLEASGAMKEWTQIDDVLTTLIGEHDSMTPVDLRRYAEDTGVRTLADLAKADDTQLYSGLMRKAYGLQRIMSQMIETDPGDANVALPRAYLLMGQRFTVDSHVLNDVTYDRIKDLRTGTKVTRMLPSELDVQFALGSETAARHLRPEIDKYNYQGTLHELRFLIDAHPPEFWDASLYNGWLAAIRALNDGSEFDRRPEAMRTAAWADKTLNTQAASWAELRHDTLLYVKQSYAGIPMCEYPDAYVEPVPAFYERMAKLGRLGAAMVTRVGAAEQTRASEYFAHLSKVGDMLAGIARKELAGQKLDVEQSEFLKATIEKEMVGCGSVQYDGWYGGLFHDNLEVDDFTPTIADIHTAPADEAGNQKGWVLHAATGKPMLMVFTVQDCNGVKAYVGPISSYHSLLTEGFQRKDDGEWATMLESGDMPRPAWTQSFVR